MSSGAAASQATKSAEPTRGEAGRRSPEDAPGPDSSRAPVLTDAGNRAIGNLLRRRHEPIPVPTCVAPENDPFEQAAHASADRIVGRQASSTEATSPSSAAGATIGLDGGQPLDEATRSRFERDLGADLEMVRIHTGPRASSAAAQLNARAYSVGNHIVFGAENFVPNTSRGSWLLAHELTHALQYDDVPVLRRAPEDVPALTAQLMDGVKEGGSAGFLKAAKALNSFADYDIRRLISDNPGPGLTKLTKGLVASIHLAARDGPGLGPDCNAAVLTRPAFLDLNFANSKGAGRWDEAAEFMNGFNDPDMLPRLTALSLSDMRSLQLGALQNPKVGKDSAVAINLQNIIKAASDAAVQRAVDEGRRTGDLTPPQSNVGTGKPGSIARITVTSGGNPDIGVAVADREPLEFGLDGSSDPHYLDNGVAHATYDVLANRFEVHYSDNSSVDLDFDAALKGARSGHPATGGVYFRNKKNGRVYPATFSAHELPVISACALELARKAPEARGAVIGAMIDVAVSAHGVGTATLRAGQAAASGSGRLSAPKKDEPDPAPGGRSKGSSAARTGDGVAKTGDGAPARATTGDGAPARATTGDGAPARSATGGGTGARSDEPLAAAGSGGTGRGGGTGARASGGGQLIEITPGKAAGPLVEGVPSEISWSAIKGPFKAEGFVLRAAYGEVKVAGKVLGEGALVQAAPTARVVGSVAELGTTPVSVGGKEIAAAVLVTGGKFVPQAAANAGRVVLFALVLKETTYLIVSPAAGTDQPVQAPGTDSTTAVAPGKDSTTAVAPGQDRGASPVRDPGTTTAVEAPGPVIDDVAECKKLVGAHSPHWHHIFPRQFREQFAELGIKIDDFTVKLPWAKHIGKRGVHINLDWNEEWAAFFEDVPHNPSDDQRTMWAYEAIDKAVDLMGEMRDYLGEKNLRKLVRYRSNKAPKPLPPK